MFRRWLLAVAGVALLGACSSESSPEVVSSVPGVATATQSPVPTASSAPPSATAADAATSARDLVDALAKKSDPDAIREGLKLTTADSVAHIYVQHQANMAEAALDGGSPFVDDDVSELPAGEYKVCEDPSNAETCGVFGGFKSDATGKIVDLTVNDKALKGRLTVGNGQTVKAGGGKFTFLTAYKAASSENLFVTVKMEAGSKMLSPFLYDAAYRSPDGKQRKATYANGPSDLDPESNSVGSFVFQSMKPGGRVTLEGCVDECANDFKAVIKVG